MDMLEFYQYLAIICVAIVGFFLKAIYNKFSNVTDSVNKLNTNVEKLILQHEHIYDRVKKNEEEIYSIKNILINKEK